MRVNPGAETYPALAALRIGCVQYLNSKPLIHGYRGRVRLEHPSQLARGMIEGMLDAALVPIFEAIREPGRYLLVDDVAIASDGPVYSVFLAYRGDLSEIRTIALDPASLTSAHLLQVLLAEYHGLRPACVATDQEADARLLIGNQAIEFRQDCSGEMKFLDLGEEWKRQTGLPFVFALWLLRDDVPDPKRIAEEFRALKRAGVAQIEEIVRAEPARDPAFVRRYLCEHIRFGLGPDEKAGIAKFRELLTKYGFVNGSHAPLRYV